ncbi:MAG: hypothetical protein J6I73_09810 [Treponema sp.]|nr:hypothetical protein [Treponema sp.]
MAALVVSVCIINIILWLIFFIKWRKLFSTDDVIAKARSEMNNMIRDIDKTTARNVSLIENGTKKLQRMLDDIDRRVAFAQSVEAKRSSVAVLQGEIKKKSAAPSVKRAVDTYKKNSLKSKGDIAYAVTEKGGKMVHSQHSLFDDDEKDSLREVRSTSYTEVPVVVPEVFFSDVPVAPKKNFNKQVADMAHVGLTVEQIAKKLSCSTTEVQMVLDMQ